MKPNFKSGVLFGENLMGGGMRKIKVIYEKARLPWSSDLRSQQDGNV